jgi:hypothetical protein
LISGLLLIAILQIWNGLFSSRHLFSWQ